MNLYCRSGIPLSEQHRKFRQNKHLPILCLSVNKQKRAFGSQATYNVPISSCFRSAENTIRKTKNDVKIFVMQRAPSRS